MRSQTVDLEDNCNDQQGPSGGETDNENVDGKQNDEEWLRNGKIQAKRDNRKQRV